MGDIPTVNQKTEREAHVSIEMVNSITGMLRSLPALSSKCCIYRVPERLREVNLKAYKPTVVSIGPFHHGEKHLQPMEEHKLRYLQTFLNRTERSLEDYLKIVRTWEEKARHYYAETIELSSEEFVTMILVDGSFVVELLLRFYFPQLREKNDRIFHKPWMITDVSNDMMLLENQFPFFVLEGLFNLVSASIKEGNPTLLEVTHEHFKYLLKINELPKTFSNPGIKHFLDFIRNCYLSSFPRVHCESERTAIYECPPSVTKLHEAGVKFKMGTSCSLLDVKFTHGILEIPHLKIEDNTETLFRNLIAFEQCHCTDKYISHYMFLLDGMVNTSKDVDLLGQYRIITSMLGSSKEVSVLFNSICKNVISGEEFYFSTLCRDLNAYCRAPQHKWKATLKRDYCNTPWRVLSIFAGLILLVLTLIQAVCSLISVPRGP
ncbi:hypothetical protein L1049_012682 [Liquidambar formosana]|uniref:Uncharacterized protein n=1 Tax=Liquidambar formosana TaxID=63359 RepID=A0AAP0WTK8_LIQFO